MLLVICKKHIKTGSTNLFSRNHPKLCFWLRRESLNSYHTEMTKAATGGVLWKKLFSKIWQYLQEKACAGVSDLGDPKVADLQHRLQHRFLPVAKFLQNIFWRTFVYVYGCFWPDITKWLFEIFFLDSGFRHHPDHPDSIILQKYQSLSNQSFKLYSAHMPSLYLTPKLSFEPRFRMII